MKALSTNLFQENVEENKIILLAPEDVTLGQASSPHGQHHGISVHQRISILTELVTFVMQFDVLKSTTPDIQNDYSYFKREVNSSRMQDLYSRAKIISNQNSKRLTNASLISTVSMWVAENFPCSRYLRANFQRTHADDLVDNGHLAASHTSDYYDSKHADDRKNSIDSHGHSNSDSPHPCKPGYEVCPAIVSYGLIANIICSMFHRKHEWLFSESSSPIVDVKDRYIKSMISCAVLFDVLLSSGSTTSANASSKSDNSARISSEFASERFFSTQSIFAPGSFVKTSKLIAVVNEYMTAQERNKLFNMIKFCSATYLNKNTKPTIMKLMDVTS
jgi:hypothetical protein